MEICHGESDWSRVFSTALQGDFTPEEIQQIYQLEMEARSFFDWSNIVPEFLSLQNIKRDSEQIQYYWASRFREAVCPFCGTTSHTMCHDYFDKPLQDIPQDGPSIISFGVKN